MARYTYEVRLGYGTTTVIQNVQTLTVTNGRVQVQDPFRAGTATITGRVPSSLPTIEIGDTIEIFCVDPSPDVRVFSGTVADLRINYGIVSNMDTWTLDCEDSIAGLGRTLVDGLAHWDAGDHTYEAALAVALYSQGDVRVDNETGQPGQSLVSAQSVPFRNSLELLQQIMFTEQGRLVAKPMIVASGGNRYSVGFYNRDAQAALTSVGAFTDDTVATALSKAVYDVVQFNSQADSFFDQVLVAPEGLAEQRVGTGNRVFTGSSYNLTTSQAADLAGYVLATLQVNQAVAQVISCNSERQTNDVALNAFVAAPIGNPATLILRGSTYNVFLNGATLTADPDQTRFTFNVISSLAQNFFVLDSASFGVLDTNRLGF